MNCDGLKNDFKLVNKVDFFCPNKYWRLGERQKKH